VAFSNRTSAIFLGVVLFLSLVGNTNHASAQTSKGSDTSSVQKVDADFKGTVGLGLIGAELGFVIPTVCGLRETWSLIVFPILGAGGGAAAGYFLLEKGAGHPTAAVAVLVTGMTLVIPAAVLTLWATMYRPEDEPSSGKPSELSVKVKAQRSDPRQMARAAGPGLIRWSPDGIFLGAPAITPTISGPTLAKGLVLKPRSELRVALVSGRF
jgi:hypothetical protein